MNTSSAPSFVSVIIPCRNEERFIENCINSIMEQEYPHEWLEILVVDGMSTDNTRAILQKFAAFPFIKVLPNQKIHTGAAFNLGIREAKGDVIMIMGAHALYPKDYIKKCVWYLKKYNVDNVGGIRKAASTKQTLIARSIVLVLSHPIGIGNAYYIIGSSGPRLVDTVFCGCYRRDVFERVGLFNEKLIRSQDMEFNVRLKRRGGKILLAPDIICYYYPPETLASLIKKFFTNGVWSLYPLKFVKTPFYLRHYTPLIFVGTLIATGIASFFSPVARALFISILVVYGLLIGSASLAVAVKERDARYAITLPLTFAIVHVFYGLGSIIGLIQLALPSGIRNYARTP